MSESLYQKLQATKSRLSVAIGLMDDAQTLQEKKSFGTGIFDDRVVSSDNEKALLITALRRGCDIVAEELAAEAKRIQESLIVPTAPAGAVEVLPPKVRVHSYSHRVAESANGFPRRNRTDLLTPAELAIRDAVGVVESVGAHPLLTDAVTLLEQAREKVADYVDGRSVVLPVVDEEARNVSLIQNALR